MSAVANKLLTAEEFWLLPESEGKRELVRGEVVEWMPVGGVHGEVVRRMLMRLGFWAEENRRGYVATEVGYVVRRNPDGVRAADVSFVAVERVPEQGIPEGYWDLAPDLAVEVVSPNETAEEVWEKVNDYLAAGTPAVWVIYPKTQQVAVFAPDGSSHTFNKNDSLEDSKVLPGFSCKVLDLFAA